MDLMPTEEQTEIAATVAGFLADRLPVSGRGWELVCTGAEVDPALWSECADLGWLSLGLGVDQGGVGFGLVEEMMLFRELGRGVAPGPFLPCVLGAHLAAAAGANDLTAAITSGEMLVALGTPVVPGSIGATVHAELSVVHTDRAELVLVCDHREAALVPADACAIEPIDPVEGSITAGRARLDGVGALVSLPSDAEPVFLRGLVLAAAGATGVAEAALAAAVGYAGQRVQFGTPIGAFQAVKHRCADMAVAADGAFAQVSYAAVALRDGLEGADVEAAVAKYHADETARTNAEGAVHIHGAMGFTAEATPHRFVYRSHLLARCLSSRAELLDRIVGRDWYSM